MRILEEMKARRLFCDGGMGSLLQAQGLKAGELPELWNLTHPEVLRDIHRQYLAAGADIMTTNTFGANRLKYRDNLEEIVAAAVGHARTAVEEAGHGYVALTWGPRESCLNRWAIWSLRQRSVFIKRWWPRGQRQAPTSS